MAAFLMEVALVETTEADRTAGRPVGAATLPEVVFQVVIPVMEMAIPVLMDQVVEGHQMMGAGATEDPVRAAVVVPEVAPEAQGALTARGTEIPRMRVMMVDVEEVVPTPQSRRF